MSKDKFIFGKYIFSMKTCSVCYQPNTFLFQSLNVWKFYDKLNPCFPVSVSLRHLRRTMYMIHHKTRQVSPTPLHPRSSCHIFNGDLINDFKLWWIYSIRNISSFRVIEILGWKGNCSRLTQLEVEWESDEYLELDLFSGKKRGCWEEQNKFMFLTSLSTKTQIGTFFSLCFLPTKENVFGKFCNTSPSFPLNINTFCLSPSNAMLDPKKTIAIREGLEGRALSKSWHCYGKEIPTGAWNRKTPRSLGIKVWQLGDILARKYICLPLRTLREKHCQGRNLVEVEKTLLLCCSCH